MTERDQTPRVWLITGATSGFGLELTKAAAAGGDVVFGAARSPERLEPLAEEFEDRVFGIQLDVTDTGRCAEVVEEVVARAGRIDVLVNNAGRTQVGAVEETTEAELRDLFDLHFFGPVALTRAALPHFRDQGSGFVVQMSSVGGQVTMPGFGAYCATKFALEGLTETLSQEVAFGVRFLIVEPGAFRTGLFAPGAPYQSEPMAEYAGTVGPTRDFVAGGDGTQPGDPAKAAQAILQALDASQPPLRLVLGEDAVTSVRDRLITLRSELEEWESLGRDTAFDSGTR
jgi:NAD(P)-dependent dehydrogenase (short-subunit alcohol dehydrogenase family)